MNTFFSDITKEIMADTEHAIPNVPQIPGLTIRYTVPQDAMHLKEWLSQPEAMKAYPMCTDIEIDDAARRWISFSRLHSSLTIEYHRTPVGIATLHVHWYKRMNHQCDFAIIIHPKYRGKGFGGFLISSVMKLAKKQFKIDLLHLQVYQDNPAIRLYSKFGFKEFGQHPAWIKDGPGEYASIIYMGRRL